MGIYADETFSPKWEYLHPMMNFDRLGYIPCWLSEANPKPAREQLNDGYAFGGWTPFKGFILNNDNSLSYPGDQPLHPLAKTTLHGDIICFYQSSWVAIIFPDRTFEVCRLD